jgi:hypothetical protein
VGGEVSIDSKMLLLTDFINLKIKLTQFFEINHKGMIYMRIFIRISDHTCMIICVYPVFVFVFVNEPAHSL